MSSLLVNPSGLTPEYGNKRTMAESGLVAGGKVEALTGTNYQVWALKVSAILRSRKLYRAVIEGVEPAEGQSGSNEAKARELWETKNDEAFGIIVLNLSSEQAGMFIGETRARHVWEELEIIHTGTVEDKRIDIGLELKTREVKFTTTMLSHKN